MQVQRELIRKKPVDQEQTLLDLAHRLPGNWGVVHIHLSRVSPVKRNENIVFALQMFENSVRGLDGRLLVLKSGDWIYLYPDSRMTQAKVAVSKLSRLFASDPLYYNEERYDADFATWYVLDRDRDTVIRLAETLCGMPAAATPQHGPVEPVAVVPAAVEPRLVTRSSELIALAQTVEAIERTNLAAFLRRQPVCMVPVDGNPVWQFDEFYFSILDLETSLNRSPLMTGDAIVLQYVTKCLDRKLVALLRPACQSGDRANLSLNLNVSSVLTPEFTDFDAVISEAAKATVGLEFQFVDVFSDLNVFFYVRALLRERGYRIFLDGVTEVNLPFAEPARLDVDLLKVRWAPSLSGAGLDAFATSIAAVRPDRVILCRCDSSAAIEFGHRAGVTLFQGRFVTERFQGEVSGGQATRVFSLQH